jgi:hypothetical protein
MCNVSRISVDLTARCPLVAVSRPGRIEAADAVPRRGIRRRGQDTERLPPEQQLPGERGAVEGMCGHHHVDGRTRIVHRPVAVSGCVRQDQPGRRRRERPLLTATQGVRLTSQCDSCGGELVRDVGQFIDRGRLWWGVEGQCHGCPNAWCETDTGPAPEEVRQALLTEYGATRLRLADEDTTLVPVLRALREVRHLSLGEARRMAAELVEVGLVGKSVEMAGLAEGLRNRSVGVTASPA